MADPFIGEIRPMAFDFPPRGWAACDGQTFDINQNQLLFALLRTTYGGDGKKTFKLPDLRGRVAIHQGGGYAMGEAGGVSEVELELANLPGDHGHDLLASAESANASHPADAVLADATAAVYLSPGSRTQPTTLSAATVGPGQPASQPHENRQPYLPLQYCIALAGHIPST